MSVRIELDPVDEGNSQIKGRIEIFNKTNTFQCSKPECQDKDILLVSSKAGRGYYEPKSQSNKPQRKN